MGWGVAQTKGAQEWRAVENLRRQEFEAFCPSYQRSCKNDIRQVIDAPLFPSYVFVLIDPLRQRWQSIHSTFGVIRLLTDGNSLDPKPLFVHDDKIAEIRALAHASENPFPPGTLVRVRANGNPLHDMIGVVETMDRAMRVTVLMNIFQRDVRVEFVNPSELEKL